MNVFRRLITSPAFKMRDQRGRTGQGRWVHGRATGLNGFALSRSVPGITVAQVPNPSIQSRRINVQNHTAQV
jgi:hypothetical protein